MAITVTTNDRTACNDEPCTRAGTVTLDGIAAARIALCRRHARQLADRLNAALAGDKDT